MGSTHEPTLVCTKAQLATALELVGAETSAVVMTMGAIHDGHVALMRTARRCVGADGVVVVTIFVNPLQFGPGEDYDAYPRTFDTDLHVCRAEGVDVVFAPSRAEIYPDGEPQVMIDPGHLGTQLEGAVRTTHFAGVLTIVAKLLNLIGPTYAVFGEKDYQQLALIRRMVADLDLPGEIVAGATVREPDGLARSSRNVYLSAAERKVALAFSRALEAGAAAAAAGPDAVVAAAADVLAEAPGVAVDYVELRDPALGPAPHSGEARLLVGGRVGATHLIDNRAIDLPERANS